MAELRTTRTQASVADFLASVADDQRRVDAQAACALMTEVTGVAPVLWGTSIVGFGAYRYEYGSGRVGDWPAVGLSPRKQALTVYLSDGFAGYAELLGRLGPHRTGKACLYLKRLGDVDEQVLRTLVDRTFRRLDGSTLTSASR